MDASLAELLDHVPVILRRPDGTILHWSQGCAELFGYTADEARGGFSQALLLTAFPDSAEAVDRALEKEGEWTGRLLHAHRAGQQIWTETVLRCRISTAPGGPIVVEQHTDITARVELEERSALITAELEHRVRNVLSVVQSLARVTFPDAPAEQRKKMEERIGALAEANRLLQKGSWKEMALREIACEVARPLGVENRLVLDGPEVAVSSERAMDLALALHELCTNAIKYGALGIAGGTVQLSWNVDPGDPHLVHARWVEQGGPPVTPPTRSGFGTRLIHQALKVRGGQSAEFHYEPSGFVCQFSLIASKGRPKA